MTRNLSWGLSSPQRRGVHRRASGAGNRAGKVASAALAWMPSETMPRSAAFPGLVSRQPSAAQSLFHRNRSINAIGITILTL